MTRAPQDRSRLVTMRHQRQTSAAAVASSLTERGHGGRARGHIVGKTIGRAVIGIAVAISAVRIIVGILSDTSSGGNSSASSPAQSAPPSSAPVAAASSASCSTKACIASDAETLKGTVAKDNAVMTKVACKSSTVTQVVPGTYTVHCTATYSDGTEWRGIASVLTSKEEVAWEPTTTISYGSS
jgi:hypothetical protein